MGTLQVTDETELGPNERGASVEIESFFPLYTYTLLACIALVFLTQFLVSDSVDFVWSDGYSAYYAGFDKKEFLKGEYWRILTGATVHSGILHVVMNSYALFGLGRLIEVLSNRAHLAIVFILSAVGGGLLSLAVNPDGTSVGASGGIVGFLSYLAVYAFKRRRFISPEFRKNLLLNIGFVLLFGLVLYNVIDNFGHIGGLIVGAVYGLIQIPHDEYVDPREAGLFIRILGVLSLGLYILTSVITILLLFNAR